jgi:hypothetical protein
MATVSRTGVVELPPAEAFDLWTDHTRWATFVDGFARTDRADPAWPETGSKLVWSSVPAGRGTVTEKVQASERGRTFRTLVLEERLVGTQSVSFTELDDGATGVTLELDYTLQKGNPLNLLVDLVFIRRAQGDALARTMRRFAIEAAEQAAL